MATPITSRDAVENAENSSVAVDPNASAEDPEASPLKKPRLAAAGDYNDDARTSTTTSDDAASGLGAAPASTSDPSSAVTSLSEKSVNDDSGKKVGPVEPNASSAAQAAGAAVVPVPPDDAKKSTPSVDVEVTEEEIVDSAVIHQGLKDGDRIQVLWTIENEAEADDDGDDDDEYDGTTVSDTAAAAPAPPPPPPAALLSTSRWWGATLLPWDGLTEDGVVVRTLRYDAYPPDFPDESVEQVIFLETKDRLLTYPGLDPMLFRREPQPGGADALSSSSPEPAGSNDEENDVFVFGREHLEEIVDGMLMGAIRKNNALWSSLTAARQAEIAASVADKKARLLELLETHLETHSDISLPDIQRIMAQTMQPEG